MRCIILLLFISGLTYAREPISGDRYELLLGVRKTNKEKLNLKNIKNKQVIDFEKNAPSRFLAENFKYIPRGAEVIDIRLKDGRNSVFLARKGYKVIGIENDIDNVRRSRLLAKEFGVRIDIVFRSLRKYTSESNSLEAVVLFDHLDRVFVKRTLRWLRPGGILVMGFEGERRPEVLEKETLIDWFKGYEILKFENPIHLKKYSQSIIIRKGKKVE